MPYTFSVWLDDKSAVALELLAQHEERNRGAMIKVLIHRAVKKLRAINSQLEEQEPSPCKREDSDA